MNTSNRSGVSIFPRIVLLLIVFARCAGAINVTCISTNNFLIGVHFDAPVQEFYATNPINYTIYTKTFPTNSVSVTNAVLETNDLQTVDLFLTGSAGEFFAVGVSNVYDTAGNTNNAILTGYTGYYATNSIGFPGDPSSPGLVIPVFNDTYTFTANGSDIGGTNDHCLFLSGQITNNFDMSVLVTRLDDTETLSKAGLFAREDLTAASPSVGVFLTPVIPPLDTNQVITVVRTNYSAVAAAYSTPIVLNSLEWLRMTRTNNIFTSYYSTDGVSWVTVGSTTQAFNNTLYVGLAATSETNGVDTTAGFTDFNLMGARPGDDVKPTLSISLYNATNVIAKWQRTPHDYALQVATNLFSVGTNSTSQWSFLMNPIFDTALIGTNVVMPTLGRYMIIPSDLFPGQPVFIRLAQVDRVLPDPPYSAFGIVESVAGNNAVGGSSSTGTIDNIHIAANTIIKPTCPFLCLGSPAKTNVYMFSTVPGATGHNYVLQVNQVGQLLTTYFYGTNFATASGFSSVTVTPTARTNIYTYLAASTTNNGATAIEVTSTNTSSPVP